MTSPLFAAGVTSTGGGLAENTPASGTPNAKKRVVRARRARPTRNLVRLKCLDCLGGHRYDCQIPECPLYPAHPWAGKPMPASLQDSVDRGNS